MRGWAAALVTIFCVGGVATNAHAQAGNTPEGGAATGSNAAPGNAAPEAPLPLPMTAPPAYYEAPLPQPFATAHRRTRWGATFRLEGAPMGKDAAADAKMGGLGFSLRPRPSPSFAVDIGLDFLGGRDFNGEKRTEQAFTVNPMLFLNPRSKVSVYLFAGLGLAAARVEHAGRGVSHYRYVGVNGGAGLEFRFWRRVAIDADLLAFVRDRTDSQSARYPEYIEPSTGRFTNTSQGVVVRAGVVYYW